jgi:hypothetical protein
MAYGINGTLVFSWEPYSDSSSLSRTRQYSYGSTLIHSVNTPIEYTLLWTGGLNESEEPQAGNYDVSSQTGDVVNVLFDIYAANEKDIGTFSNSWNLIATIRKSRDIRNILDKPKVYGGQGAMVAASHRFTVDISEILKDELSYSLVPLGKGTWTNPFYGGLNGGPIRQDNVAAPPWTNPWILSMNGTYRWVRLKARTEILDGDGIIQTATTSSSMKSSYSSIYCINNVYNYDGNKADANGWTACFLHSGWGASSDYPRIMQSWAPNYTYSGNWAYGVRVAKDVRLEEYNEILQWVQGSVNNYSIWYNAANNPEGAAYGASNTSDLVSDLYTTVTAYDINGNELREAWLFDWTKNLNPKTTVNGETGVYERSQYRTVTQNVSIPFINANCIHILSGTKDTWEYGGTTYTRYLIDTLGEDKSPDSLFINDEVAYYKIGNTSITCSDGQTGPPNVQATEKTSLTEYRWYKVDRSRAANNKGSDCRYGGMYYTELRTDYSSNTDRIRCKAYYWHNTKKPYVRFHWLNTAGGIDSYTVKGPQGKGYTVGKEIISRNESNRFNSGIGVSSGTSPGAYPSDNPKSAGANTHYTSDTMRGMDNHKGGKEILSSNVDRVGTATTLPLNSNQAEWVREIATSPNVWIETDQMFSGPENAYLYKIMNRSVSNNEKGVSLDGRTPTNSVYTPVIITNTEVSTEDDSTGTTTITFEYTYAHQVITQRN